MKIKLRYLSKLFVLAFIMFSLNINIYAYEHNSEDFKVSYLAGETYYNVFSVDDKHYVTPSSTDLNIHPMIYSEYEYSGVTKITSAVNKVVIKDDFSSQILLETTSNYIIIDGSRAYYDEL